MRGGGARGMFGRADGSRRSCFDYSFYCQAFRFNEVSMSEGEMCNQIYNYLMAAHTH